MASSICDDDLMVKFENFSHRPKLICKRSPVMQGTPLDSEFDVGFSHHDPETYKNNRNSWPRGLESRLVLSLGLLAY